MKSQPATSSMSGRASRSWATRVPITPPIPVTSTRLTRVPLGPQSRLLRAAGAEIAPPPGCSRHPGEEHDQAVDAHPEAPTGRQPVLEGPHVVLVDAVGLVVAGRGEAGLGLEALPLVEGVGELAERVGELAAHHDRLEALDEVGVVPVGAGQGRHLPRVVGDEHRPDEVGLDRLLVELEHELAGSPAGLVGHLEAVADRLEVGDGLARVDGHAGVLADEVEQPPSRPRGRELDRRAVGDGDGRRAGGLPGALGDELLGEAFHVGVVAERLVALEHRELGVVARREALVAEHPADLEDPFEAADEEPLEVQLERDAQAERHVERVVIGGERPGGGAAGFGVQHRGLDLDVAALDEERPDGGDHREPDREDPAGVVVGDEIDVAHPEPGVDVAEAVPLLGEGPQRLREQLERGDLHRQLAAFGAQHAALGTDPVAAVELVEAVVGVGPDRGVGHEQLDAPGPVAQGGERELALPSDEQEPARHPHRVAGLGARLEAVPVLVHLRRGVGPVEAHRVRVGARGAQRVELGEPPAPLLGEVAVVGDARSGRLGHRFRS